MNHVPAQLADMNNDTWIDPVSAGRIIGIKPSTVVEYIKGGKIQGRQEGKGFRILVSEARRYAESRDPRKVEGARRSHANRVLSPTPTTNLADVQTAAEAELLDIDSQLTLLSVRKAELEEALKSIEVVRRFMERKS
jgi:predicted site-specific integrase-resolvase